MNVAAQILGRSYGVPDDVDEDELDAELAGLEEEFESTEIAEGPTAAVTVPVYLQQKPVPETSPPPALSSSSTIAL